MKIAFVSQFENLPQAGEFEKQLARLAAGIAGRGHQVFVYAEKGSALPKLLKKTLIKIVALPKFGRGRVNACLQNLFVALHALVRPYDVLHYQSNTEPKFFGVTRFFRSNLKVLVTFFRAHYFYQKRAGTEDKLAINITVESTSKTERLAQWKLKEKNYLLFCGKLNKESGVHYLIEAFKRLEDTSKLPNNFKLVLAGEITTQDTYADYLKTITRGRENVIFVQEQTGENLRQLYSHAYLFVQPSEVEDLPIPLLEAMGYGLPALVSDVAENLKLLEGVGMSFKSKSMLDLRDKLAYLCSRPQEAQSFGQLAAQLIRERYSWETIVDKTLAAYEQAD